MLRIKNRNHGRNSNGIKVYNGKCNGLNAKQLMVHKAFEKIKKH